MRRLISCGSALFGCGLVVLLSHLSSVRIACGKLERRPARGLLGGVAISFLYWTSMGTAE